MEKITPTTINWLPQKTFELTFSIPWNEVKKDYSKALEEISKDTTIEGFRKGKAPLSMVEKKVDKAKIYGLVLDKLLPQTYFSAIKKHNLRPIVDPKIEPISTEEAKDWEFKATSCEAPDVVLGDYQAKLKSLTAKDKIWVPGKDKDKKPEKSQEDRLPEIFKLLLETSKVELAQILINQETDRMLSRLLEELKRLGISLDQYLQTNSKTTESLRKEYQENAEQTLQLEFILQDIGQKEKISVTDTEIDQMIKAVPDEKQRKNLDTPMQKAYIASILRKRKVVDFLTKI